LSLSQDERAPNGEDYIFQFWGGHARGLPVTMLATSGVHAADTTAAIWIAVANAAARAYVYSYDPLTCSIKRHCQLPRFEDGTEPSAMAFLPSPNEDQLVITQSNNKIVLFDVKAERYAEWHKNYNRVPKVFRERSRRANGKFCGIAVDAAKPHSVLLYSSAFFTTLNFRDPLPDSSASQTSPSAEPGDTPSKSKKRRGDAQALEAEPEAAAPLTTKPNNNMKIWDRFQPILFMDYVRSGEIVVVEAPWVKIMKRFPDMPARRRYGT